MDPYQTPEANVESTGLDVEKKRGFWLTGFLVLMFIANPLTAFSYFSNPEAIMIYMPGATAPVMMVLGVLAVLNFVVAVGMWLWKRWGVYGYYASVVVAFLINIYIGLGYMSVLGFLGVLIIYLLTRKRWQYFS